jgi:hypothetical protein
VAEVNARCSIRLVSWSRSVFTSSEEDRVTGVEDRLPGVEDRKTGVDANSLGRDTNSASRQSMYCPTCPFSKVTLSRVLPMPLTLAVCP